MKESTHEYMLNYKVSKLLQESNNHSKLATHMEMHQECLTTDSDHSDFDVPHFMVSDTFRTTVFVGCENCFLRDQYSTQLEKG